MTPAFGCLRPEKTHLVEASPPGGGDFLGYHVARGYHGPRAKRVQKRRATRRPTTRRLPGQSLAVIIADVNRVLRGGFAYFQHSHPTAFRPLAAWMRTRMRSIRRQRRRRQGRARGADHHRGPNRFFAEPGLFSLTTAHAHARQSCAR